MTVLKTHVGYLSWNNEFEIEWINNIYKQKHIRIRNYIKGLGFEEVHFIQGRYKWKKNIDYLVDDSPQNWHAWRKGRGDDHEFILVDAAYNKHIPAENRIFKLTEAKEIIG